MLKLRVPVIATVVLALGVCIGAVTARRWFADRDDAGRHYLAASGWPSHGEAAYRIDVGPVHTSPHQAMVPIASLAKVMTAYLVLRSFPLAADGSGFTLGVTQADVADTATRRREQQSVLAVQAGEHLTERQALTAMLLPSANNIAVILAKIVAGSETAFVALMNDMAHALGMRHTIYTDPSGYEASTRSTAADQLILARAAMANPAFAAIVGLTRAVLPVAGVVHNTDTLLGHDGFAGIKTGSMSASGGCFVFVSHRVIAGKPVALYGAVLGQPGHNLVTAALTASRQLADAVAPAPV